jgi:Kef-type K+ transport system membrane component KefB
LGEWCPFIDRAVVPTMAIDTETETDYSRRRTRRRALALGVVGAAALAVAVTAGAGRTAPDGGGTELGVRFLVSIAVILVAAHGLGRLAHRFGQPPVVGEIAAGLLLAPGVLGAVAPGLWAWLFPDPLLQGLGLTAQLGLVCFMFLLGWETDVAGLRNDRRPLLGIGLGGFALPFALGAVLAVPLFPLQDAHASSPLAFALFLGLALSITAVPVLARVLADSGIAGTRPGRLAMMSAIAVDVVSWGVLAVVLALSGSGDPREAVVTVAAVVAFVAAMVLVVRPLLAAGIAAAERATGGEALLLPIALVCTIAAAAVTEAIGVHAVFGAFVAGAVMPRRPALGGRVADPVRSFSGAVLLPLYFASVGMSVVFSGFGGGWALWLVLLGVLAAAAVGKIAGVTAGARLAGLPRREAAATGVLMNCRGLTELIIADIGLRAGIIDTAMFTVLVLVALITTAATGPLLRLVGPIAPVRAERPAPAAASPRPLPGSEHDAP